MSQDTATSTTASAPAPPQRRGAERPWLLHGGMNVRRFVITYTMGAAFPVLAGLALFGWRALGAIAVVAASSAAALVVWRRISSRGLQLRYDHALWMALLLAMMLPAHLFSGADPETGVWLWPALAAGGVFLVIFMWLLGGIGAGRVHPVIITHLLLFVCFKELLVPQHVLQLGRVFIGDLLDTVPQELSRSDTAPWIHAARVPDHASISKEPASQRLLAYTSGARSADGAWISLDALLRDRMPPLEDLMLGGHPAPIGSGSAIAVIIGGLFLLYRGVIDYRVPLIIALSAMAAVLVLPVPVVIKENEAVWHWCAMRVPDVGWQIGFTLASYELFAGPLLLTAFFLATSPAVRPIARRARAIYAMLVGVLAGVFQLYVSVAIGPYLALLAASLFTPWFDKLFKPRTLV